MVAGEGALPSAVAFASCAHISGFPVRQTKFKKAQAGPRRVPIATASSRATRFRLCRQALSPSCRHPGIFERWCRRIIPTPTASASWVASTRRLERPAPAHPGLRLMLLVRGATNASTRTQTAGAIKIHHGSKAPISIFISSSRSRYAKRIVRRRLARVEQGGHRLEPDGHVLCWPADILTNAVPSRTGAPIGPRPD